MFLLHPTCKGPSWPWPQSATWTCHRVIGDAQTVDTPLETFSFVPSPLGSNCAFLLQGSSLCPLVPRPDPVPLECLAEASAGLFSNMTSQVVYSRHNGREGLSPPHLLICLIPDPPSTPQASPLIPHHLQSRLSVMSRDRTKVVRNTLGCPLSRVQMGLHPSLVAPPFRTF